MKTWPSTLPLPRMTYSAAPAYNVAVSDRQEPIVQARKRFSAVEHTLDVEWAVDAEELTEFRTFFVDDLDCGSQRFSIQLSYPPGEGLVTWAVVFDDDVVVEYEEPGTALLRSRLRLVNRI